MTADTRTPGENTAAADGAGRPRKDHRAAVQAHRLRMSLAENAIRFGDDEPSVKPRPWSILLWSAVLAAVMLVAVIGTAVVIQML